MLKVNDRIALDKALGTIKFVGHLDVWGPNTVVYGVEWDDASRGKNSGDHNDVQYFKTQVKGAGLFVKASNKKIIAGVSLWDAILGRYASEDNERALDDKIQIGSKTVENYGFHKLNEILRNITALKTVMLDRQNVVVAGNLVLFPITETLDLSFNLLAHWTELDTILRHFPALKSLNLNGNRLFGSANLRLPSLVSEILLASSQISVSQLNQIDISNVEKLVVASNNWTLQDAEKLVLPPGLIFLDLSFNQLTEIPLSLPQSSVRHLNLADNTIETISGSTVFPNIVSLDLRYNPISSWDTIDNLSEMFPNMRDLRVDNCPDFATLSPDEMSVELIARLECGGDKLSRLNGSTLTPEEIRNAELYFISKVQLGNIAFSNEKRWKQLLEKYRIGHVPRPVAEDSRTFSLHIHTENGELFTRTFLNTTTVLRLKGVISKKLARRLLDLRLHFFLHGVELEESREYLDDDIASLRNYVLSPNQKVYVSLCAK